MINNFHLYAQDGSPAWVIYQRGLKSYEAKDYSSAFEHFRDASVADEFPEAEYWIGRIFEIEGEYTLALKQYERALNLADKAMTKNYSIIIRLRMAGVYEKTKNYKKYQETLEKIISSADLSDSGENIRYAEVLAESIMRTGIDKLLYFYRHEGDHLIKPHGDLGVYYFAHGRDQAALVNLTSAFTIVSSNVIRTFMAYDPDYEYADLLSLLKQAESDEKILLYLERTDYYKYLFYLALVLNNYNLVDQSAYIFTIISESSIRNNYQNMASRIAAGRFSNTYIKNIKDTLLYPTE